MSQKPSPSIKASTDKTQPLKPRKVSTATARVPFLDMDEFVRRRQTGPLSRYIE